MAFDIKEQILILIGLVLLAQVQATIPKFSIPQRFSGNNESVFAALNDLKSQHHPLDFGVARPNFKPPTILTNALSSTIQWGDWSLSQYSSSSGLPRLRSIIAKYYSRMMNRTLNPDIEVVITVGATQALFTIFQTHTSPGDEWILIEPYFSSYEPMIRAANGVPKFVPMRLKKNQTNIMNGSSWVLDEDELSKAFNSKTKGILLNTPHNPTGKVFTLKELEVIANLSKKWNTLVISDEVYEFLVFGQNKHIKIATLPGMFERTITIGSGGKAFAATGFKIGWAYGDANIIDNLNFIHENIVGNAPTPLQEAFAIMMEHEFKNFGTSKSFLHEFKQTVESKRDQFIKSLVNFGMSVTVPDGGPLILAKWTPLLDSIDLRSEATGNEDVKFARWMVKNVGILAQPASGYYGKQSGNAKEDSLRFCYVKTDELLKEAEDRFRHWRNKI